MIDDVTQSGSFAQALDAPLASCVCGCGCNCLCICLCGVYGTNQANYQATGTNNNQSQLNNTWYQNAVAGQG